MARKKYFYPPAPSVGSETFSDNIVGLQLVTGGGLTQGNFEFTSAIYEKVNRKFDTGLFSEPYTLENLNIENIEQTKKIIEKNFKVYPNFDISQVTSFSLYGSLQKRFSSSITKIINYFPAAIEINNPVNFGLDSYPTAYNITFDVINNETTFESDVYTFSNPFGIDFSENARRNLETRPLAVSKYRNLTDNFESYSLYFVDLNTEYPVLEFIPTKFTTGGTVTITVQGDPFNLKNNLITETYISLILKPNNITTETVFNEDFDEIEDFLLNRKTTPLYTTNFKYPDYDSNGNYNMYNQRLTWRLDTYWNLDISSTKFDEYLTKLQKVAESLDNYKTNLISRFLITGSFKEFDTADQKVEKILQIYGRSFDEVKKFIDALANMNSVNYVVGNDIPSQLLVNLAQTLGLNTNISPITNENFLDSVLAPNSKQIFDGQKKPNTPNELNYQYYRNLILNTAYLFKSKGTRRSVEFLMRMIGAPDALIEFNEIVYLADSKINLDTFDTKFANLSGGTFYNEQPALDPTLVYSLLGNKYTGFTTSGVIQLTPVSRTDYPTNSDGLPLSPNDNDDYYFQIGSGWFEQTPEHRSIELPDLQNSSLIGNNPFLISYLKPFTYGQDYLERYRNFPYMGGFGFEITKTIDNQKSWDINTEERKNNNSFNGVNYITENDDLVLNTKMIELYLNMGQGITYDIWDMSVKYDYPIPNSGLTAPYPSPGNIDWTHINPKPKEKTFFEFAQNFYNNFINVRNRWTISDGKTSGYPTLQSIFWRYLQSNETVGIPSNNFTYQKMIDFTLGIGDYWQRLVEQVVPATTIWMTGQKMDNSIFHRQKVVWRRQRGCTFIPVDCIPCTYNGQIFTYDCIDQTLTCSISNLSNPLFPAEVLNQSINNLILSSGYTQTQCDLTSVISTWFIDCRLDDNILIQNSFFTGYGDDAPTTTEILNAIETELDTLYSFGLNYYLAGNNLVVSNTTCYDDFTNKTFYLNIGVDIDINCNN
jgi:hypothetical protein